MNTPRYSNAMVSANGNLYAAGGYNNQYLESVECFDLTTRVWTTITPMNEKRTWLQLVVLADKLYAIIYVHISPSREGGDSLLAVNLRIYIIHLLYDAA